jgi:hypothetical protein
MPLKVTYPRAFRLKEAFIGHWKAIPTTRQEFELKYPNCAVYRAGAKLIIF